MWNIYICGKIMALIFQINRIMWTINSISMENILAFKKILKYCVKMFWSNRKYNNNEVIT